MTHDNRRQMSIEADRIARGDAGIDQPGLQLIPRDEVIRSQPRDTYRPPSFLARTATAGQVEELEALLHRLWEMNEEHAGENTLEVQVYYSVTGLYHALAEEFRCWAEAYFTERADPRHVTPQLANDPFLLFEKRSEEIDAVLGRLSCRKHTLNSTFLNLSVEFAPWLLYRRLWQSLLQVEDLEDGRVAYSLARAYQPSRRNTLQEMCRIAGQRGWLANDTGRFLGRVRDAADPARIAEADGLPDAVLRERLAGMAADMQEMRPLLVGGFKPRKTTLPLGPGLAAAWAWCVRHGIANLLVGGDEGEVAVLAEKNRTNLAVAVGHDGLLFDSRTPWLKADTLPPVGGVRPLVLDYLVLETFHRLLFSFYDRIDLRRVRSEVLAAGEGRQPDGEAEVAALAASCGEVEKDEEAPAAGGEYRRIRSLRSTRLFALLSDRFGCEVTRGKGSEMTVYRDGGKKFRLGHHGRCVEIHPLLLRRMLGRLGISPGEWLRAVAG